jgi:hypothetical protein
MNSSFHSLNIAAFQGCLARCIRARDYNKIKKTGINYSGFSL